MDQRRAAAALLALAACIACSAAAPTAGDHTALELHSGPVEGCYYNFQHYGEGDRIMTNEPCLNCTCHNRMLMCYLRVCPFTKAIGQDCTVEKRADQCCPIVTCPDVPVDLLTSTSTSSPAEYGATGLGKLDKYGCSIHGKYFPEGSKVPPTPNKPCEHCYCIRNMTTCVMQECTLHVDGCTPIYHKDVCCPVRYSCDHPEDEIPLLDDMTTTVRPTPGFLLTTTTMLPVTQISQNCIHDDHVFPDGALIKTEKACEHCYCMKGDIVCVVQECGTPMENEGKNCTSLPPRHGQCCPDTYICEGDERVTESATEIIELTSPPRRVGVEGSGYRNEPDEPYTEISPLTTDIEGSGEDLETSPPISTLENFTPGKETSGIIAVTSLTPIESDLTYSQSTEPDKGQNTIPDSISDKESTQEPIHEKVTFSHIIEPVTDVLTTGDVTSRKDEVFATESGLRKEDEVSTESALLKDTKKFTDETFTTELPLKKYDEKVPDEIATMKVFAETTTFYSDLLDKSTSFKDAHKEFTSPEKTESYEEGQVTTSPLAEYTSKDQEPSQSVEPTTNIDESSGTDKNKITYELLTSPETETYESSSVSGIKVIIPETTTFNPNINEVNDNILPPSRIPGEGDCLLNGLTYSNNSNIPSTSNCHTGCKCISSIIKCDPIICSPPPDYMENMNDCQPIYDTPESCCPTYVCSVKETIPPQSHSQMSGTESPIVKEECGSIDCKNQLQETPSKPSLDCVDEKCQVSSVMPCEGENCKTKPTENVIPEKDLYTSSHEIPTHICNDQSGCKEHAMTGLEECVDENCRRKGQGEVEKEISSDCTGLECKLQDKSTSPPLLEQETVRSTGEIFTEKTTESAFGVVDIKNTESIESHLTIATEKIELDKEVTKPSIIYTESSEKLSSSLEEIVTEIPKHYDDNKDNLQTDIPTFENLVPEKVLTTIEPLQTESPKLPFSDIDEHENIITETTLSQNTYSQTEKIHELLTSGKELAKPTQYFEVQTEESFTRGIEKLSTEKPQLFTYSDGEHETILDDMYTKLPPSHVTESENETPEYVVTEKKDTTDERPDFVEEEKIKTIAPEKPVTEKSTTYSEISKDMFTNTETTQPNLSGGMLTDKVTRQFEKESTEKELAVTSVPAVKVTEKIEVTELFTERGDIQTESLNKLTTGQEEVQTVIPDVIDKKKAETETLVVPTTAKETISTTVPDMFVTEKQISETKSSEVTVTEKAQTVLTLTEKSEVATKSPEISEVTVIDAQKPMHTETPLIQTETPSETITKKEGIQTDIPIITLDSTAIKTVSPDQHELQIETTTEHKYDQSLVEDQTLESITSKIDEIQYSQVTEESITKQQTTLAEEFEIDDKQTKVYDDLHKPELMTPYDATKKDTTTEHTDTYSPYDVTVAGQHISKTKTITDDTFKEVTETYYYTPKLEELDKTTKVVSEKEETKEQEMYTKPSYGIVTESDEGVSGTDKGIIYTSSPMIDTTKSVEEFETVDQSVTESQTSKVPELSVSQFAETSTEYGASITEKHTKTPEDVTESITLSTHEVSVIQEKATTISQISSKKLPELHSTLAEDTLITEKSTEKYYSLATTELEKQFDIEKETNLPNEVLNTTLESIEEITEKIPTKPLDGQIPSDQKLDLETPHLVNTVQNGDEIPESSIGPIDEVTKKSEAHSSIPVFIEEQHELSSKTPVEDLTAVTKYPSKETVTDNLTESTYKDEPSVDQDETISRETTKVANEITESYIKTTINPLIKDKKQEEILKATESSHISESESAVTVTSTQESELVPATDKIDVIYTLSEEEEKLSSSTETVKEVSKLGEKIYDTTEKHDLEKEYLPKQTSSSQTIPQISEEISTETLSFPVIDDADKNIQDVTERSTKIPDITLFELSSVEVEDKEVTTQSIIPYTTSEDIHKFSTIIVDEKEIPTEQEISDKLPTTSSSLEDYRKTTDLPMSLITGIYQGKLPETTKSEKDVSIIKSTPKTPAEEEFNEEQKQTHLYVTESMHFPDHHVTSQELVTESSTDINISLSTLVPQLGEKTSITSIKDEYSINEKVTPIFVEQTDVDITTSETLSEVNIQKEEVTPILDSEEGLLDSQQQKTTTVLLPTFEKQHDIPYEQTPLTEPVDKVATKYPHEEYTVKVEVTTIPSKFLEIEHDKDSIDVSTEAGPTDEKEEVTAYPDINIEPIQTILPEKETSESDIIEGTTDIPRPPTSSLINVPFESELTEKPVPIVTEIIEPGIHEKELASTKITQSQEETTIHMHLELSTEKEKINTEHTSISESTEAQFTSAKQQESITEVPDGSKLIGESITSTQSLPSDSPKLEEQFAVTEKLEQEKIDEHSLITQVSEDTIITEVQTDSAAIEKATTVSPTIETETPKQVVTLKETEIYNTQPTSVKEELTTESAAEEKTSQPIVTLKETEIQSEIYSTQSTIVKEAFTTASATEEETQHSLVTLKDAEIQPEVYSTQSTIVKESFTTKPATEEETPTPLVTLKEADIQSEIYSTQATIIKEAYTTQSSAEKETLKPLVTLKDVEIQPEIYSTQFTIVKETFTTESAAEKETPKAIVTSKETEIQSEIYNTQPTIVSEELSTESAAEEKTQKPLVTLKDIVIQPEIYSTQSTIVNEELTTKSTTEKETPNPIEVLKENEIQPEIHSIQPTSDKEEFTTESATEEKTPKPIVTLKETDIHTEIYSTQPTVIKESLTTILVNELSKETEKTETVTVHQLPTEVIPVTLGSSINEDESAQTHKELDFSDDIKTITEPTHEFSETTPFLVELTEHAHEVIDDSSRTTDGEVTTIHYKPQQSEGDQEFGVTKKYEDKYPTLLPITEKEHIYEDKEQDKEQIPTHIDGLIDHKVFTTASLAAETSSSTEIISSTYSELSLHEQEKKSTIVPDLSLTTSKSPTLTSEKDSDATVPSDIQKVTYSIPETLVSIEKDIHVAQTEKPSETNIETTLSQDIIYHETPKATTIKIKDETSTYLPKPEEKPIGTTLSPLQEAIKPSIDDEINDNLPSPDFPPSGGYGQEPDYSEEDQAFGPGTCRYGGKVYVSAQQIPRDDPCDFCFCFRSDIICLQQSCPPPIHGCHEEPIQGFCCPRYECPVSMATTVNVTTTTTTTTTTLPPHFLPHAYKGAAQRRGCQIKGHTYKVGEIVRASSGPCLQCSCGGDGQMKCDPKVCTPEPMLRQMIAAAVSAKRRR